MKTVQIHCIYRDGGSVIFSVEGVKYILDRAFGSKTREEIYLFETTPQQRNGPPQEKKFVNEETKRMLMSILRDNKHFF